MHSITLIRHTIVRLCIVSLFLCGLLFFWFQVMGTPFVLAIEDTFLGGSFKVGDTIEVVEATAVFGSPTSASDRLGSQAIGRQGVVRELPATLGDSLAQWLRVDFTIGADGWVQQKKIKKATPDSAPPTLSIIAPAPDTVVSGVTAISARATDAVGIRAVFFTVNNPLIQAISLDRLVDAPYRTEWDTTTVPDGRYTVRVNAFDLAGNRTTQTVAINVKNEVTKPSCSLTVSPTTLERGQSATLSWTTANAVSGQFNKNLGVLDPVQSGTLTVRPATTTTYVATVTDGQSNARCNATVVVASAAPFLSGGDTVRAASNVAVRSSASISATNRIGTIVAGRTGTVLNGPVTANNFVWWEIEWPAVPGTNQTALRGWSVQNYIEKVAGSADTTKPKVSLTSPTSGVVSGTVQLTAEATDNVAVAAVEFKRGRVLIAEDTTPPYGYLWDVSTLRDGNYGIRAVARDAANNYATSTVATVTVQNMSACTLSAQSASQSIPTGKAHQHTPTVPEEELDLGEDDLTPGTDAEIPPLDGEYTPIDTPQPERMGMAMNAPVPNKIAIASGPWNNTATWGGSIPTADQAVRIPAGLTVTINTNAKAKSVEVGGVLRAAPNVDSSLKANWVMVSGPSALFEVGTGDVPFTRNFTLELSGNNVSENIAGAGSKFLMAMNGGKIVMAGTPRTSWTKLSATVAKGANKITLADPVGWQVGDRIVIAPTGLRKITNATNSFENPTEAEERTIVSIGADCRTITLDSPLEFRHLGTRARYTEGAKTWLLDQRAEVGLLSRNIKIQGDPQSDTTGFGAHVMIMGRATTQMPSGSGQFQNVEFYRVGQKSRSGRYPIHWHMVQNDGLGQFIKDSSIHRSYNRAVTIHATNDLLIQNNVAYDHIGHGIFLEDGVEQRNAFRDNLVILTKRPRIGEEVIASDNERYEVQNRTPASFWITNPNNIFVGNVVAGTVGTAYWFALPVGQLGLSRQMNLYPGLNPSRMNLGEFRGNVAHAVMSGFDVHDAIRTDDTIMTNYSWVPPQPAIFRDFTLYGNAMNLYSGTGPVLTDGKLIFDRVVSADAYREHLRFANYETVRNSLFVANSGNGVIRGDQLVTLYALYDGAGRLYDSHVVGFDQPGTTLFKSSGASQKRANHLVKGLTFDPDVPPRIVFPDCSALACDPTGGYVGLASIVDVDGSLTGTPNHVIITNHPVLMTSDAQPWSNGENVYVSPRQFQWVMVNTAAPVTWRRSGGGEPTVSYLDDYPRQHRSRQIYKIVGGGFTYTSNGSLVEADLGSEDTNLAQAKRSQFSALIMEVSSVLEDVYQLVRPLFGS